MDARSWRPLGIAALALGELLLFLLALRFPTEGGAYRGGALPGLALADWTSWGPRLLAMAGAQLGILALAWRLRQRGRPAAVFAGAALGTVLCSAAFSPGGLDLARPILSTRLTSVYGDAQRPDLPQVLDELPARVVDFRRTRSQPGDLHVHTVTRPPGWLRLFSLWGAWFGRLGSVLAGGCVVLAFAAGVFPLARLVGEEQLPVAATIYAVLPGALAFVPLLDLVYPPLVLWILVWVRWALDEHWAWAIPAGLLQALALCTSYVPLTWLAIFAGPVVVRVIREPERWRRIALPAAVFLLLAPVGLLLLAAPHPWSAWELFQANRGTSDWIDGVMGRGHPVWGRVGPALEQLELYGLVSLVLLGARARAAPEPDETEALLTLGLAFALVLGAGLIVAESMRVLLFLGPLLAWALARTPSSAWPLLAVHLLRTAAWRLALFQG